MTYFHPNQSRRISVTVALAAASLPLTKMSWSPGTRLGSTITWQLTVLRALTTLALGEGPLRICHPAEPSPNAKRVGALGTLLPKRNAIVLFVGVTQNGERVLFSVAPEVTVRGEGGCVGGAENCRFLSMRAGQAVDLLTGSAGRSFRLKVVDIDLVELELPSKEERASGSRATEPNRAWALGFSQNFSK